VKYARVAIDSNQQVATAGITARGIGIAMNETYAANEVCSVRLNTAAGTQECIASEAIVAGSVVYTAASGQVSDTAAATSYPYGIALDDASGVNSVIEVLLQIGDTAN